MQISLWHFNKQMYVTPPDTDVYSIPKVLAPMPQKVSKRKFTTLFSFLLDVMFLVENLLAAMFCQYNRV